MKTIDVPEAVELLQAAVNQRGAEMTYNKTPGYLDTPGGCFYWHNEVSEPGCIVGLGLWLKGYASAEDLQRMDKRPEGSNIAECIRDEMLAVPVTLKAAEVLQAAQEDQDYGRTWGLALETAKTVAKAIEKVAK